MNQQRLMQVLLAPQVSEKARLMWPTKMSRSFSALLPMRPSLKSKLLSNCFFKVVVDSVQIANVKGKQKKFGRFMGSRKSWKRHMFA